MAGPELHPASKFTPFSLTLSNGATLTGISHIPLPSANTPQFLPLLVGVHGGTCTSHNYDVDADHTASLSSSAFGIPFVAINRPCYADSTSFLPLSSDQTFYQETGRWEHNFILPALWAHFGLPNHCTAMVTTNHSLAVPSAIIAASLYAQDPSPAYPLAGIILSGFGTRLIEQERTPPSDGPQIKFPTGFKNRLMLNDESLHCANPTVFPQIEVQNVPMPLEEIGHIMIWVGHASKYTESVTLPIMYAMGEHDWLWEGTVEHVDEFRRCFPKTPRFDGSVVLGGPHALEWGYVSPGWYARCFGWAMEVVANVGVEELKAK